jgi:hypothetical protein
MLRESFAIEVFFVCVYCVDEDRFKMVCSSADQLK